MVISAIKLAMMKFGHTGLYHIYKKIEATTDGFNVRMRTAISSSLLIMKIEAGCRRLEIYRR